MTEAPEIIGPDKARKLTHNLIKPSPEWGVPVSDDLIKKGVWTCKLKLHAPGQQRRASFPRSNLDNYATFSSNKWDYIEFMLWLCVFAYVSQKSEKTILSGFPRTPPESNTNSFVIGKLLWILNILFRENLEHDQRRNLASAIKNEK